LPAAEGMTVRRATEIVLGLAMAVATGLIVYACDAQGFAVDELPYYARIAAMDGGVLVHYDSPFSPEYLLAPFNGHLALGGRVVYETVFATVGAHYTVFVAINALGICASAGLLFVFARRRIGDVAALAPCLLILFLGIAREQFLWPFDLHTSLALAAGLSAVLVLERGDRRGDVFAALLLVLSVATIEVGLAFVVGSAVLIAMGPDRLRRAWIAVVPLVLYAAWWVWANRFGHEETNLANLVLIPKTFFNSIAVVLGSFTGTNPVYPWSFGTDVTDLGRVLAVVALVALVVRIVRGELPRTIWVWLAATGAYWTLLAIGERPAQSTRYLFVSAVLVLLIAVDCFRRPLSSRAGAPLVVLALLPLPANVEAMLGDKELNVLHNEVFKSRTEFAMLELARDRVPPGYRVSADPWVTDAGGGLYLQIPAGAYLDSAEDNGSIAYTLDEVRQQPEGVRAIADAALAGALDLELVAASGPDQELGCRTVDPREGRPAVVPLRAGVNHLRVSGTGTPLIGLRRFADTGGGVPIAKLRPGGWASLRLPPDAVEEPWRLVTKASLTTCSI
jgi:hypothetical protein